jgi:hypothetical protein
LGIHVSNYPGESDRYLIVNVILYRILVAN